MKKTAVILCGSGAKDGSEIHEATFALAALDAQSIEYQCFALDQPQAKVINFINDEELSESRNQLLEAARIARGNILPLSQCRPEDYDGIVFPGGFGVAYNLSDFAEKGANATVKAEISQLITAFHSAGKPIGVICIAPVLIALTLGQTASPTITSGAADNPAGQAYQALGCTVKSCESSDSIIDRENKIFSTPAYMNDASISEVQAGITKMIGEFING